MLKKPDTCKDCPLYRNGFGFSTLDGDGSSGLLVIAESLGRAEERDSLPLRPYAPSGSVFQRALDVGRLQRDTLTITNILRCKSEAPHPQDAINHCRQYLDAAVAERRPRLLLALGDVPLRELSLVGGTISELRGYVLPSRYGIPMIATYHPSHLARGAFGQLFGVFLHDVRQAYRFAREGIPTKLETNYVLNPTHADLAAYLERLRSDSTLPVAHDTETEEILGVKGPPNWRDKRIIQVQFSSGVGEAIVVEFPAEREFVQAVYATVNPKWGYNDRLSDRLALRSAGIALNGELHDLMNAYLHLQPGFASGKDAGDDEDKGVPAKLANLQSCLSFYHPEEGIYKGMVQQAVVAAKTDYAKSCAESEGTFDINEYTFVYDHVMPLLQLYGAKDADYTYRVGVRLFTSLKKLGLW